MPASHAPGQSAVARVENGSLTPTLSRWERGSRMTLGDMPKPVRPSRRDSLQPTPRSTLRNLRYRFSFSFREKAEMRATRCLPRATVDGLNTCPNTGTCSPPSATDHSAALQDAWRSPFRPSESTQAMPPPKEWLEALSSRISEGSTTGRPPSRALAFPRPPIREIR